LNPKKFIGSGVVWAITVILASASGLKRALLMPVKKTGMIL